MSSQADRCRGAINNMGGKKEPKKLTQAQQQQLDAKNREKVIEDVWKACKNDKPAMVTKALTLGYTVDYMDEDVRIGSHLMQHELCPGPTATAPYFRPRNLARYFGSSCAASSLLHPLSQHGHTAFHRAAAFSALGVIRVLFNAGASLETQNKVCTSHLNATTCHAAKPLHPVPPPQKKETPLDVARDLGDEDTIKLMEALAAGPPPLDLTRIE